MGGVGCGLHSTEVAFAITVSTALGLRLEVNNKDYILTHNFNKTLLNTITNVNLWGYVAQLITIIILALQDS